MKDETVTDRTRAQAMAMRAPAKTAKTNGAAPAAKAAAPKAVAKTASKAPAKPAAAAKPSTSCRVLAVRASK